MTPAGADEPVRVLVVDDQTVVREGLVSLLSLLPGKEVVGAAVDGDDAIRQAWATDPDVVVLTTYSDDAWVFSALQADARGFLTKDAGAAEIRRAIIIIIITTVAGGHAQLDPSVQSRLLDALRSGQHFAIGGPAPGTEPGPPPLPDDLTPREDEVLTRIAAGLSNQEIATVLFVSEAAIKTHINHIFTETGLRDRAQLVGYTFRQGLATLD